MEDNRYKHNPSILRIKNANRANGVKTVIFIFIIQFSSCIVVVWTIHCIIRY